MNTKIKSIIAILIVAGAILGFFWLANLLGSGEKAQSEKPLVICPSSAKATEGKAATSVQCFWTAHIHATAKVFENGKEIPAKFEKGKLEGQHTHSEKNKLHWHGLIPVDPKTKDVIDWSALSMEQLLKDLGLSIEDGPQIIVNGKEVGLSHIWKDGDTIEIRYAK